MKGGLFYAIFHSREVFVVRGYSYRNITPLVPKHATYLPDEIPSAPHRIVILSGRKRSMYEKPQPEQVGTEPKDLTPYM